MTALNHVRTSDGIDLCECRRDEAGASIETRKKIVRLLIAEIIADVVGDKLELAIHWHGGDHTCLSAKGNRIGQNQWVTDADVVYFVRVVALMVTSEYIDVYLLSFGIYIW